MLELGDKRSSVDRGGTKNFRTGFGGDENQSRTQARHSFKALWVKRTK